MTTRVEFGDNVEDVVSSIDDVKRDLRVQFKRKVGTAMTILEETARTYIREDPDADGTLLAALDSNHPNSAGWDMLFQVYVETEMAPYAAIVEFGSGDRTGEQLPMSEQVPPPEPSQTPIEYPFDEPDIQNIDGFAYYIEQWMRSKNIAPRKFDSIDVAALAIAKTIDDRGTYAHPFMRPAWFDNELKIRRAAQNALRSATG